MSLSFPRDRRISTGPELQRVLKEGKRIRTKYLDVRLCASPLERPVGRRVGLIVPKAKHSGVERNLLKRRLRELSRTVILPISGTGDVVLIARADSYQATYAMLALDIHKVSDVLQGASSDTR